MLYPVTLDRERIFKYGMKAISLVEKKFKKPIAKIDMESLTMEDTAVLIWAGLFHEDAQLTPDKVMTLVDDYSNMTDVMEIVGQAMEGAFASKKEDAEEGKN